MTPQFAAGMEAAKYTAMAGAVDDVTQQLVMYQEEQTRKNRKLNQLAEQADTATLGTNLDILKTRAESEKWSQEEWNEAANAEIDAYLGKVDGSITERQRDLYRKVYETQATRYRGLAFAAGEKIHLDRTKETWLAAYDRLGATKDYHGQMMMLETAGAEDGVQLFDAATLQQMERKVLGEVESDALMNGYKDAVKANRADEYLMDLSKTEMSDETRAAFEGKRKDYDILTREVRLEQDMERAENIARFTQSISPETTDEEIYSKARSLKIKDYGTINMWLNERDRQIKANNILVGDYVDPHDMETRKSFNLLIQGDTPEERVQNAQQLAMVKNIVPEYLDGYYNSRAYSDPADFMTAGENWIQLQEQTPGLPNGVKEEARLRLNLYKTYRVGFGSEKAAQMVISHFDGMDNDRREANRKKFDTVGYGNQDDQSPRDFVVERVKDQLKKMAEQGLAAERLGRDEVPRFPAEMMRFIETAGESLWANAENEEAVADTIIQGIAASGWKVTDINKGVETGDLEFGAQWMRNPPPRPKIAREQLMDSIGDEQYLINKQWQTIDPERVEFWRQVTDPQTGKPSWILRVDGSLIFNRNLQKQAFMYDDEPADQNLVDQRTREMLDRLEKERTESLTERQIPVMP